MSYQHEDVDILFIVPPYRLIPPFKYKLVDPPRSVVILATILSDLGFSVEILDMPILELDYPSIISRIEMSKPKVIGIR